MSQDFDIAIIGAGIAGASTAWALLEAAPQLRVLLIEMEERPGYHTTGRSAAIFIESYGGRRHCWSMPPGPGPMDWRRWPGPRPRA